MFAHHLEDLDPLFGGEPRGRREHLEAHARAGVARSFHEQFGLSFDLVTGIAQHTDRGGPHARVVGIEQLGQQIPVDPIGAPSDPERFEPPTRRRATNAARRAQAAARAPAHASTAG